MMERKSVELYIKIKLRKSASGWLLLYGLLIGSHRIISQGLFKLKLHMAVHES